MVTNYVPAGRVGAALAATECLQVAAKAAPIAIAFILDSSQRGKLFLAKSLGTIFSYSGSGIR